MNGPRLLSPARHEFVEKLLCPAAKLSVPSDPVTHPRFFHFAQVAEFLTGVIAHLERKPGILAREPGLLPAGVGLNINYPPVAVPAGVALSDQGRTASISGATLTIGIGCYGPCAALPVGGSLPGGITGVSLDSTPERRGADTTAFQQGYITIVPITPDYTAAPSARFNSVFKTLGF